MLRKFRSTSVTAAIMLVINPALGSENEMLDRQALPESNIAFGIGATTDESPIFGLYNGMPDDTLYLKLDFALLGRDDATGTWFEASGSNLGLDSRELSLEQARLGDWGYRIDFSELTRSHPYTINTGLTGAETDDQQVAGTTLRDQRYEIERTLGKITLHKRLGFGFDTRLSFRHEDKEGARPWGSFINNFVTEPIDHTTNEVLATVDYTDRKMQLSGGYLFSNFVNANEALTTDGGAASLSLPLDNQAHQLFLSAGYDITPTTRANMKLSRTRATQDERFFTSPSYPGNSRTGLDGEVVTLLAKLGLSARPMHDLSLNANLRYEDRDDRTPRSQFVDASTTRDGFNVPFSRTTLNAALDASYRFAAGYRLSGGYEREEWDRSSPPLRQVSYRDKTAEDSFRVGLHRSMSEHLNGSLTLSHSERGGSDYLSSALDAIDPLHWADRVRDKLRLTLDWLPAEPLSVQVQIDLSQDAYDGRVLGPKRGEMIAVSLDSNYQLNDEWQIAGWLSYSSTEADQSTGDTGSIWRARLRHDSRAVGIGVRGLPRDELKVGLDLQASLDESGHRTSSSNLALEDIPDIFYRQLRLNLFADYLLTDDSGVRIDLVHQRVATDDWTWDGWVYADGTTVLVDDYETVNFIGLSYHYRWR